MGGPTRPLLGAVPRVLLVLGEDCASRTYSYGPYYGAGSSLGLRRTCRADPGRAQHLSASGSVVPLSCAGTVSLEETV